MEQPPLIGVVGDERARETFDRLTQANYGWRVRQFSKIPAISELTVTPAALILRTEGSTKWIHSAAVRFPDACLIAVDDPTASAADEYILAGADDVISPRDPSVAARVHRALVRRRRERRHGSYVSTVAHELRTPLTAITGALRLLDGGIGGDLPDTTRSLLGIAGRNATRLGKLVNDVLDLERMQVGALAFDFRTVQLQEVLEGAVGPLSQLAADAGVEIVVQTDAEDTTVHGDPSRLEQVIVNLLSNAVRYAPSGSRIAVGVSDIPGSVRAWVRDEGAGIPEHLKPRMFERFSQATATAGGSGLGLAISRLIIERHGGTIGHEANADRGTTFWFTLPHVPDRAKAVPSQPAHSSRANGRARVLVVEDDADTAGYLRNLLEHDEFAVDIARTGAEATRMARAGGYALAVVDLILPDEDGSDLIQRWRTGPTTKSLPVVVVSQRAARAQEELADIVVGVEHWMQKPIDPSRLISSLRDAIADSPRARPRILYVEDDSEMVDFITTVVQDDADVIAAGTLKAARVAAEDGEFDLVLLDLNLPDGRGPELMPMFVRSKTPVIVFSNAVESIRAKQAGITAKIPKDRVTSENVLELIRAALAKDES